MTSFFRRALLAAVLPSVLVIGCDDDDLPTDPIDVVQGTYSLLTVNGDSLPFTVAESEGEELALVSGTLEMRGDLTYTETIEFEIVPAEGEPVPEDPIIEDGTYAVDGSTIEFTVAPTNGEPGFTYEGILEGGTLTYTAQGIVAVYERD